MRPFVFASVLAGADVGSYLVYWTVLVRSMLEQHPGLCAPWVIIHDRMHSSIRKKIRAEYPNAEFHQVPRGRYVGRPRATYYSFEAANPDLNAKRVLFLDVDLLCDRPIDVLIHRTSCPLGMWREKRRSCYNAGVIVLNFEKPDAALYDFLTACKRAPGIWGTDQNIWNQVSWITELPEYIQRFAIRGEEGVKHPLFWHMIVKKGGQMRSRTTPHALNRWEKIYNNTLEVAAV